ncbi:MAG: EAL domain-containing protein [Oscillatoriaceae cyanobacterium]
MQIRGYLEIQKQLDRKLRKSEKKYRLLAETVPTATFISHGRELRYVNPALATISGYEKEELLSMDFLDLIHPQARNLVKQIIERQGLAGDWQNGNIWREEIRIIRKNGGNRWLDLTLRRIKFEHKIALLGTGLDITELKQVQADLQQSLSLQRATLESTADGILVVDGRGRIALYNQKFAEMWRIPKSILETRDDNQVLTFVMDQLQEPEQFLAKVRELYSSSDASSCDILEFKDGRVFERYGQPRRCGKEDAGRVWSFRDITHKVLAEAELRQSEERYKLLLESVTDYVYTVKVENERVLATNHGPGCVAVTGYSSEEYAADPDLWHKMVHPEDLAAVTKQGIACLEGRAYPLEHRIIRKNGEVRWVRNTPVVRKDSAGKVIAYEGSIRDITERKQAEAKITTLAFYDHLTGLPNRVEYDRLAGAAMVAGGKMMAVMFLDLDRFKTINDTLGHTVGDELLQKVAARIRTCLRSGDTLARWGGDEFTLLLPQINSPRDATDIAEHILAAFKSAFDVEGQALHVSTSIGIAIYPNDGKDMQTLMRNADAALYRAKEQRCAYQLYQPAINSQASQLLALENDLHSALAGNQFVVYYQPQVDIETMAVTGMEALVRWEHPEFGLVSPATFIPLAEETGLIVPIGEWVLRVACQQAKEWQDAGLPKIRMGVNLSARQFEQPDLVEMVARVLAETGLEPCFLELEITETIAMRNMGLTKTVLRSLAQMGVHLSMDDFGTGYSSLNYLKNFPFHTLKLDRAFVRDLTVDRHDLAIASAIIALGLGLDLRVLAEGVETIEQLEVLRRLHCQQVQGFLFSKPKPAAEATQLLANSLGFARWRESA